MHTIVIITEQSVHLWESCRSVSTVVAVLVTLLLLVSALSATDRLTLSHSTLSVSWSLSTVSDKSSLLPCCLSTSGCWSLKLVRCWDVIGCCCNSRSIAASVCSRSYNRQALRHTCRQTQTYKHRDTYRRQDVFCGWPDCMNWGTLCRRHGRITFSTLDCSVQ